MKIPYLQLSKGETPSGTDTTVILDGRTSDDGSETVGRTRSDGGGLGQTSSAASRFATWLVKVHTHSTLPVLVEMVVGELLVVLDRHCVL